MCTTCDFISQLPPFTYCCVSVPEPCQHTEKLFVSQNIRRIEPTETWCSAIKQIRVERTPKETLIRTNDRVTVLATYAHSTFWWTSRLTFREMSKNITNIQIKIHSHRKIYAIYYMFMRRMRTEIWNYISSFFTEYIEHRIERAYRRFNWTSLQMLRWAVMRMGIIVYSTQL